MQPVGALRIVADVHPVLPPLPGRAVRADDARDGLPVVIVRVRVRVRVGVRARVRVRVRATCP